MFSLFSFLPSHSTNMFLQAWLLRLSLLQTKAAKASVATTVATGVEVAVAKAVTEDVLAAAKPKATMHTQDNNRKTNFLM